ncbi:hypothetical protein M9H77_35874 [Catharanthus roseus]|uniref:Uncharacterized protein n=1 Tax=Catharanthus roseus TaxID=4058 RepID=A0ACB9ZR63_CATRO|nr:hypothetical protein M9H77_35874 [Catharanthus roseus]
MAERRLTTTNNILTLAVAVTFNGAGCVCLFLPFELPNVPELSFHSFQPLEANGKLSLALPVTSVRVFLVKHCQIIKYRSVCRRVYRTIFQQVELPFLKRTPKDILCSKAHIGFRLLIVLISNLKILIKILTFDRVKENINFILSMSTKDSSNPRIAVSVMVTSPSILPIHSGKFHMEQMREAAEAITSLHEYVVEEARKKFLIHHIPRALGLLLTLMRAKKVMYAIPCQSIMNYLQLNNITFRKKKKRMFSEIAKEQKWIVGVIFMVLVYATESVRIVFLILHICLLDFDIRTKDAQEKSQG